MSDDLIRDLESRVDWSKVIRTQPDALEGKQFPRAEDPVNLPPHYRALPVECIDVAENFSYCLGNVIKYVWRHEHKGKPLEDLRKARYYLDRAIQNMEKDQ